MTGKLIIIEGSDASGKTTQTALLVNYLKGKGERVLNLKFPQYDTFYGRLIKRYLEGEFGGVDTVSPYLIAPFYSFDRALQKEEMLQTLEEGGYVVCDRYTPSNSAHHAVRLSDMAKIEAFTKWIEELEYEKLGLPRETDVVFLRVPFDIGETLITGRNNTSSSFSKDIHEENRSYRKKVYDMYEHLSKQNPNWRVIECAPDAGKLLSVDEIHKRVVGALGL